MSTARQANRPTEIIPAVPVRRSILHAAHAAHAAASPGSLRDERAPFSGLRDLTPTEELVAVPAPRRRNRPALRSSHARHLRAALVGTLLAIVAISGLSAYAAQGIADARQAALDHARSHVSAPR